MNFQVLLIPLKTFFLLALIGVIHSVSSKQLSFDLDKQKFIEEFQSLSDQIEHNFCAGGESIHLYVERGNLLLIADEFESAINNYTYVINSKTDLSSAYRKMFCQALWGRMWAYTFLGQEKEAINDIDSISQLLFFNDFSEHDDHETLPCKKKNKEKDRDAPNIDGLQECLDTVGNTQKYMIGKAYKVENKSKQNTMIQEINALYEECKQNCYINCCYKDYWLVCVQPMVEKIEQWKKEGLIK